MNKLLTELTSSKEHKLAVLQLYRSLLRKTNSLQQVDLPASVNQFELQFSIKESFKRHHGSTYSITQQFLKGIQLNDILTLNQRDELVRFVNDQRKEFFQYQQRRASYLQNKSQINTKIINNLRGKAKIQMNSMRNTKQKYQKPDLSTAKGQTQFIHDGLKQAEFNGPVVLQQYIHELQSLNKLPDPKLLPYTPELISTTGDNLDSRHIIGGTTKAALNQYDQDIINSIIIPELEYELNMNYLTALEKTLKEKGPFKAVIKLTTAGIIALPYIEQPTKHKIGRKELAILVKKQILRKRMLTIWEANEDLTEENLQRDGSYPVSGSKGFGPDEFIYPRKYYQPYYDGEELYEVLLRIEINKYSEIKKPIDFDDCYWGESLDISTQYVKDSYNEVIAESQIDLLPLQKQLQKKYDASYEQKVEKYDELIKVLGKNNVFKHGDIAAPVNTKTIYKDLDKRGRDKFPINDRAGKGKTLSDYIRDVGLKNYEYGNKFTKRVVQILKTISKKY